MANRNLTRGALLAALAATACAGGGEPARGPSSAATQGGFPADSSIRAMLADLVPDPRTSGAVVGLLEPDGRRRVIAYGSAAPGGPPVDAASVFEIGSVSKVFLGVLLADMARRGQVELDEPLARLLPPTVRVPSRGGRPITLLDLATHTSGLPAMPGNFPRPETPEAYAGYTTGQLYDFLSGYELPREPGGGVQYSNLVSVLGHALALRAGRPYEALLRERVLAPLGLERTAATPTREMERHRTRGHDAFGDPAPDFVAPAFVPSGGLRSTAGDLLDFAAANLAADTAGIHASLRSARRPRRHAGGGDHFGLGWGTDSLGLVAGHSGGTMGYNSYLYVDAGRRRALVVLMNTAGRGANELGVHLLDPAAAPRPRPSAARAVASTLRAAGRAAAAEHHHRLRATAPERWRFDEPELNALGYRLLARGAADDAVAVFRLNVETHPASPNAHDSLGDGYRAAGRPGEAVASYRRAVALAEAAGDPRLSAYRASLESALRQAAGPAPATP